MRTLLTLVCAFALACSAGAAKNENKSKKQAQNKRQVPSTQHARPASAPKKMAPRHNQAASHPTSHQKAQGGRKGVNNQVHQSRSNVKSTERASRQIATQNRQAGRHATSAATSKKAKQGQQGANAQVYQPRSNAKTKKGSQQIAAHSSQHGRNTTSAAYSKKTKQWNGNRASAAAFQSNGKKLQGTAFQFNVKYASDSILLCDVSPEPSDSGQSALERQQLLGLPELPSGMAQQRLVAESL